MLALGVVVGLMNASFYLAIARLPLGTVGAIEFLGPIMVAAWGIRTLRNVGALTLCLAGVALLANVELSGEPIGVAFAAANCGLFTLYIVLGHRIAQNGASPIDQLAAALAVVLLVTTPLGFAAALPAMVEPSLLLAGIGVGICSSVIPYVCDQMAMARLPRASFALMLSLLPATATVVGLIVLGQAPSGVEIVGIGSIILAIAIHQRDLR